MINWDFLFSWEFATLMGRILYNLIFRVLLNIAIMVMLALAIWHGWKLQIGEGFHFEQLPLKRFFTS